MLTIEKNYSLRKHNSFGLDVKAAQFVEYSTVAELKEFIHQHPDTPLFHIGGGNNLLFTQDYSGTILHSAIHGHQELASQGDHVLLRVGAAEDWDTLVAWTLDHHYYGLENLSLIPSEVGASAVQNIGAYGAEAKDFIESVEVVDLTTGEEHTFSNSDCDFAYRYSNFKGPWRGRYAVTYVTYRLSKHYEPNLSYRALAQIATPDMDAQALRQAIIKVRQAKLPDPAELGNAGSFFMNPVVDQATFDALQAQYPDVPHYPAPNGVKVPAGWLIEQSGWKGKALGPAAVYEKQALVLVNRGGATPRDIMHLSDTIRADVKQKFGIDIHPEVNWI